MSKEMKMADVSCDVTFVDYVAGAVKNHDRLVEENKWLRDTLVRLISSGVAYQNLEEIKFDLDSDDIASIEAKFNDELIRSDKLITELGGGDD